MSDLENLNDQELAQKARDYFWDFKECARLLQKRGISIDTQEIEHTSIDGRCLKEWKEWTLRIERITRERL